MVKLYNKQTNEFLGRIPDDQWQRLTGHLEEGSRVDRGYYIRKETLDDFERAGADARVVELLRASMKPSDAIEIRWDDD